MRVLLGFGGVLAGLYGVWLVFTHTFDTRPLDAAIWAVGGLLAHDAVIAPVTFVIGYGLSRVVRSARIRYAVGGLALAGGVSALLVWTHLRSPSPAQNPTVLPGHSGGEVAAAVLLAAAVFGLALLSPTIVERLKARRPRGG